MFRLQNKETGLWYKSMDEYGDITWTGNKAQACIFPPEKRQWWEEEYGDEIEEDEIELVELGEDEVMNIGGMARLPGF